MLNKQKPGSSVSASKGKKSARSKSSHHAKEKKEKLHDKLKNIKLQLISVETELENERNQRNKLQIERDKLQQFWDTSKDHMKEMKQDFLDRTQKSDDANEKLQKDISFLNEKMQFLMRDHERELMQIHESEIHLHPDYQVQTDSDPLENVWTKINSDQTNLLLEKQVEIEKIKKEYEKIIRLNKESFENELQNLQTNSLKHHQDEMRKFKLAKLQQFDELLVHHQNQIKNLQQEFNTELGIKKSEVINLQKTVSNVQENYRKLEESHKNILVQNQQLENQIKILNEGVDKFSKEIKRAELVKRDSELYKKQLKQTKTSLQEWKEKYEILYQKSLKVEKERDKLYGNFQEAVRSIQHQASWHKNILSQQIAKAEENLQTSNRQRQPHDMVVESRGLDAL